MNANLQMAIQLHQTGQLVKAEKIYQELLDAHPESPDILYLYGVLNLNNNNEQKGLELIKKAIRIKPDFSKCYVTLSLYFKSIKNYKESLRWLDKLIIQGGSSTPILIEKAMLLNLNNQHEQSLACYQTLIKKEPGNPVLYFNLGNFYLGKRQLFQAEKAFAKAAALNPENNIAFNYLGLALEGQLKYNEAITAYKNSLKLLTNQPTNQPTNQISVLESIARVEHSLSHFEQAIEYYQQILVLDPTHFNARLALAKCYMELERFSEALNHVNDSVNAHPEQVYALILKGEVLWRLGEFEKGYQCFIDTCLKSDENLILGFHNLMLFRKKNSPDIAPIVARMKSIVDEQKLLDKNQSSEFSFYLSRYFEEQGDYRQAFQYLKKGNQLHRQTFHYDASLPEKTRQLIRELYTEDLFDRFKTDGHDDASVIFIVGMPRSGTTLAEQILSSHSKITGCGELPTFGEIYREPVISNLPDQNENFAQRLNDIGKKYTSRITVLFPESGMLVDKMPGNFWYVGLIALALPNARIIHCRRDPLETCLSIYKQTFGSSHPYAYTLEELGEYYLIYRDVMAHWEKVLGNRIHQLDYESVVYDTESETRKLLSFCGVEFETSCIEFYNSTRLVKTASVAQVRQPIYTGSLKLSDHYKDELAPLRAILAQLN